MPTRSRTPTSLLAPPGRAALGRGRSRHIVDVACDYARAHRAHGWTAKEIARRRGRSPGYGSMVLRLGLAVVDLSSAELALFRTPRVTLLEISRRLRRDMDVAAIRRMLLSLATTPAPDGRRGRGGTRTAPSLRSSPRRRGAHTWRWDETAAAHDPAGAVTAWLDHVRATERELAQGLRAMLAGRQTEAARILAAHGMRGLAAALRPNRRDAAPAMEDTPAAELDRHDATGPAESARASRLPPPTPPSRDTLVVLDAVRALDAVVAELARIERALGDGLRGARGAPGALARRAGSSGAAPSSDASPWSEAELAAAIEEDLAP